jgi:hypothetical protein
MRDCEVKQSLYFLGIVAHLLKARFMKRAEAAVGRERLCKHVRCQAMAQ